MKLPDSRKRQAPQTFRVWITALAVALSALAQSAAAVDFAKMTPLFDAAATGDADAVFALSGVRGKVDWKDGNGFTALMYASAASRLELIGMLLERGANPEIADAGGRTALHFAAGCAPEELFPVEALSPETADRLVRAGAVLDTRDLYGNTPLHCAVWAGRVDVARVLLELGADPGIRNSDDLAPVDLASQGPKAGDFEELFAPTGDGGDEPQPAAAPEHEWAPSEGAARPVSLLGGVELPVTLTVFVPRSEDVVARGGEPDVFDGVSTSLEIARAETSWTENQECAEVRASFFDGWGDELAPAMALAGGRSGYQEWRPDAGALAVTMKSHQGTNIRLHTTKAVLEADESAGGEWVRLCHVGFGYGPGLGTEVTSVHFRDALLGDLVVSFPSGPVEAAFRGEMENALLYGRSLPDPEALLVTINDAGLSVAALVGP